jgi:hypothetical protein
MMKQTTDHQIAECLVRLGVVVGSHQFSSTDTICLAGEIVSQTDQARLIDLLSILKPLAKSIEPPMVGTILWALSVVQSDSLALCRILEIAADIYHTELVSEPTLDEFLFPFMERLSCANISLMFFGEIFRLVKIGILELMPIWYWIAASESITEEVVLEKFSIFTKRVPDKTALN